MNYVQAFVAKFDPAQTGNNSLVYSTILGNTKPMTRHRGHGIAAYTDSSGNTLPTSPGSPTATDFPTTGNAFNQKWPLRHRTHSSRNSRSTET